MNGQMSSQGPADHVSAPTRLHSIKGREQSRKQKQVALACILELLPRKFLGFQTPRPLPIIPVSLQSLPIPEVNFCVSLQPLPYNPLKPGKFLQREVTVPGSGKGFMDSGLARRAHGWRDRKRVQL